MLRGSPGEHFGFILHGRKLIKKMMEVYGWDIQENGEPQKELNSQ
jgi:hypothetical protein